MNRDNDKLTERLRELDPAPSPTEEGPQAEEVLRAILTSEPAEQGRSLYPQSRRPSLWRRKRVLAPLSAAAALALALVVGLPGGGDDTNGATIALDNLATAAASQPSAPGELPFLYLKTRSISVNTAVAKGQAWSVYDSELREEWSAEDGSGRVRVEEEAPAFVGAGDRAAWEAAGKPNFLPNGFTATATEHAIPPGSFDDASALPDDPDALAVQLRAEAEETHKSAPVAARMLELIAEDLRNPAVGPEQRAALYLAAQRVPGIDYFGATTDAQGRDGLAVGVTSSYSGGPTRYLLISDPQSAEVLAYEMEASHPAAYADSEGPLVISATIFLGSGSAEEPPPREAGLGER
jgi:hypothetical protein